MSGHTWKQCLGALGMMMLSIGLAACGDMEHEVPPPAFARVASGEPGLELPPRDQDAGVPAPDAGTPDAGGPATEPLPFVRLKPGAATVTVGQFHTVRWESSGVERIRLDMSFDGGAKWRPVRGGESLEAAAGAHTFKVTREWLEGRSRFTVAFRAADLADPKGRNAIANGPEFSPCPQVGLSEVRPGDYEGRGGFVEIIVQTPEPMDMSGWRLMANGWDVIHTVPAGVTVQPGGVIVVWQGPAMPEHIPATVRTFQADVPSRLGGPWNVATNEPSPLLYQASLSAPFGSPISSGCADDRWENRRGAGVSDSRAGTFRAGAEWTVTSEIAGLRATPGRRADGWAFDRAPGAAEEPVTVTSTAAPPSMYPSPLYADPGGAWRVFHTIKASGGTPPYRFGVDAVDGIPGVSLNPIDGKLIYIHREGLTAPMTLEIPILVTDDDEFPVSARQLLTLSIHPRTAPFTVATRELMQGELGRLYDQPLQAIGYSGAGALEWRIVEGALPPGLRLEHPPASPSTYIYGEPTVVGVYPLSLEASFGTQRAQRTFTLTVADKASGSQ
jgi:hypothetical protein